MVSILRLFRKESRSYTPRGGAQGNDAIYRLQRPHPQESPTYAKRTLHNPNRKSAGQLAEKVNCAETPSQDEEFISTGQSFVIGGNGNHDKILGMTMPRSLSWGGGLRKMNRSKKVESFITRPVLITVKDGEFGRALPSNAVNQSSRSKLQCMSYGKPAKWSPFQFGTSNRKKHSERSLMDFGGPYLAPSALDTPRKHGSVIHTAFTTPVSATVLTPREIARRERWKRGLVESGQQNGPTKTSTSNATTDDGGRSNGNADGDDSVYTEEEDRTTFTQSTGGTNYFTDYSSLGGSSTEATETDESGDDSRCSRRRDRRGGDGTSHLPPPLDDPCNTNYAGYSTEATETDDSCEDSQYSRKRNRRSSRTSQSPPRADDLGITKYDGGGLCSCRHQVLHGITEDVGIVASFLWADGTACLGTAVAITKETVVGCRGSSF